MTSRPMLQIHIYTDNAAFDSNPAREAARILRGLTAGKLREAWSDRDKFGGGHIQLRDVNGNTVGRATWVDQGEE